MTDEWVQAHCLPHLMGLPRVQSRRALPETFWQFYLKWKDRCLILADVVYPVDGSFLAACVRDDEAARRFAGPYPLIDVSSLMLAAGYDPLTDREAFTGLSGQAHDPLHDAAVCAMKVVRLLREKKIRLP